MKKRRNALSYVPPMSGLKHFLLSRITVLLIVFLSCLSVTAFAQNKKQVSGKVTAQDGKPLAGVTIFEKGSNNGTTTKDDGSFSITLANDNAVLEVSAVGYSPMVLPVKGKQVLTISMTVLDSE